jgi:hypothetical protein
MVVEDKHMAKIKDVVKEEITSMFEQTLDFCQVACPEANYRQLRSKVLRVGNNCIRDLHKKIEDHYKVQYIPVAEDIIQVQRRK